MLSNPRSDRIRVLRALSGRSFRARNGRFLLEGPQVVREAVRVGAAIEVLATEAALERFPEIFNQSHGRAPRVQVATAEVIDSVSDSAQGIIGTAALRDNSLQAALPATVRLVVVLLENQDPGNAGTIIRTADAAGADAVVMTRGSVDIYNPKVVRATAGSLFHVPIITGVELDAALGQLRARGLQILAADGGGEHDLDDLQTWTARSTVPETAPGLEKPTAWLFGNEARGLAGVPLGGEVASVRVPIHGRAESLNLAIATALCLYASARAQRAR